MSSQYSQQSLTVLSLFGILAGIMASLSVILIFQVQDTVKKAQYPAGLDPEASEVLLQASAVFASLCLALNASCLLLCLLQTYHTAEACRDDPESGRGDWFLLANRSIRQSAIYMFCLGICLYLGALSLYMLILFEIETGIASACILASGAIFMVITVAHTTHRASQAAQQRHNQLPSTLFENDSAPEGELNDSTHSDCNNAKDISPVRPRPEIHREFSYPPFLQQQQKLQRPSPGLCNMTCLGNENEIPGHSTGMERYNIPRMQRTLSAESGLIPPQPKQWNGLHQEMRPVITRKPGVVGKDSTLV
ncbi:transmembrane protein 221 [Bombina bombina]|uniref:transmembrane protein 221 n=1 Tax=Bombina bombina TaxID=8345 RepID=UPI00235AD744|nr:transmembrane protein 221 [Bombina bombina]